MNIKNVLGGVAVFAFAVLPWLTDASGTLSVSQTIVNLRVGDNNEIRFFPPSGQQVNLIGNTNAYVAHANISDNTMVVYGLANGFSALTVCTYDNYCNLIMVNVSNSGNSNNDNDNDDDFDSYPYFVTNSLPHATRGESYSTQLDVDGGDSPYNFYINSGRLPNGLDLSSRGRISGRPTSSGTYSITFRAVDDDGRVAYSQMYSLRVGGVSGTSIYDNGALINDNGTVYIIYKNTKSAFANMNTFNRLGYKQSNVVYATTYDIPFTGYVMGTDHTAHAWGTWLRSGQTVYFSHEDGLIPIARYDVFINNGGSDAKLVNINSYDWDRPMLSLMRNNDSRLRP